MTVRSVPLRLQGPRRRPGELPSALRITWQTLEDLVRRPAGRARVYTSPGFREHVRRYDPAEVQLAIDLTEVGLLDSAAWAGSQAAKRGPSKRPFAGSGLPAA